MCLFLLVGCGYNIYYMSDMTKNNDYATYNKYQRSYPVVTYDKDGYNEYQQPNEETRDTATVDLTNEDNPYSRPSYYY